MSTEESIEFCERLFDFVLDGAPLRSNASHLRGVAQWTRFPPRDLPPIGCTGSMSAPASSCHPAGRCRAYGALLDRVGLKLAMEDAIALDAHLANDEDLATSLVRYQAERSVEVLKLQNAARNSTEWFEHVNRYAHLAPERFAYSLLTRSQRISHENLRVRDQSMSRRSSGGSRGSSGLAIDDRTTPPPAIFTPYRARDVTLPNRIVVSPMAQYTADNDGMPTDWHFVHLGARATGGAGMVATEMTCVSPEGRITPGAPGSGTKRSAMRGRESSGSCTKYSTAKIALQLGHSGGKGATKKMWEGVDQPLPSGEWPLFAASEQQYLPGVSQVARDDRGRHGPRHGGVRALHSSAGQRALTGSSCTAHTVTSSRDFSRRSPIGATTSTVATSPIARAFRCASSRQCVPSGPHLPCRCASPRMTGPMVATRRTMPLRLRVSFGPVVPI